MFEPNVRDRAMSGADEMSRPGMLDLDSKMHSGVLEPWSLAASSSSFQAQGELDLAMGHDAKAGLVEKTHSLRRNRLASAAVFLAMAFGVLLLAGFFGVGATASNRIANTTVGLRCAIAAVAASLLRSRVHLSRVQIRVIEYVLFGSFTILMAITQYYVNLEYFELQDPIGVTTTVKNGVLFMIVLMVSYGVFIPNDPRSAGTVVLSMTVVYSVVLIAVLRTPGGGAVMEPLNPTRLGASNILYVVIGAGMAIYGAYTLNGLRTQLHEARKFGQYQIGRKLGEGGMGEVYLAEHKLLKRPCALKLIKAAKSNPITMARFEREVRAAARLAHPNTIEIYDYGLTEDGKCYYVMEFLQGMNLADLVQQHGPLPPGRLIYLMRQVCAGLAEAHEFGLVHRDLKPANIFIAVRGGESDVVKVLDFGLVKLTQEPAGVELSSDKTVSGTPLFMSPEQIVGDGSLDGRSDIYSLGVVMYVSLTGKLPFTANTPMGVMMAHVRDAVISPAELQSGLPPDLEAVVLRCLAKKPNDRYPTVKALGEALAACASAGEWGANRADAWWASVGMTALEDET